MVILNGSAYRLCGLDTCILSDLLEHDAAAARGFVTLLPPSEVIPCFSPYTLFELRSRREIYEEFLSFFDVYPCIILKNEDQLFKDELDAYPNPEDVEASLFPFSFLNKAKGMNLRALIERLFDDPSVIRRELEWPILKEDLLRDWLNNKDNFSPSGERYNNSDANRFVQEATVQQLMGRAPRWSRDRIRIDGDVKTTGFPSLRMILYTLFFRLYASEDRVPQPQDVFDVLISASTPYLDAVITENFQADIYSRLKKLDPPLSRFRIYTIRNLLEAATAQTT